MDLDQWISKVKEGQHLLEDELQLLCEYVRISSSPLKKNTYIQKHCSSKSRVSFSKYMDLPFSFTLYIRVLIFVSRYCQGLCSLSLREYVCLTYLLLFDFESANWNLYVMLGCREKIPE